MYHEIWVYIYILAYKSGNNAFMQKKISFSDTFDDT